MNQPGFDGTVMYGFWINNDTGWLNQDPYNGLLYTIPIYNIDNWAMAYYNGLLQSLYNITGYYNLPYTTQPAPFFVPLLLCSLRPLPLRLRSGRIAAGQPELVRDAQGFSQTLVGREAKELGLSKIPSSYMELSLEHIP